MGAARSTSDAIRAPVRRAITPLILPSGWYHSASHEASRHRRRRLHRQRRQRRSCSPPATTSSCSTTCRAATRRRSRRGRLRRRATCSTRPPSTERAERHGIRRRPALRGARARRRVRRRPELATTATTSSARCNLLDAMRAAGVKRLVFSSTCAVYGEPDDGADRRGHAAGARQPLRRTRSSPSSGCSPTSAAAHGLGARRPALLQRRRRAAATIGEDHDPETHLIPLVLQAAARPAARTCRSSAPTTRRPTAPAIRDYIHVEDLADGAPARARARSPGEHRIYNLGTGKGFSVREVIDAARRSPAATIPADEAPRRPGDPPRSSPPPRARSAPSSAGSRASPSSTTMIGDAWAWAQAHPAGYGAAPAG